jgi:hypothetical protein
VVAIFAVAASDNRVAKITISPPDVYLSVLENFQIAARDSWLVLLLRLRAGILTSRLLPDTLLRTQTLEHGPRHRFKVIFQTRPRQFSVDLDLACPELENARFTKFNVLLARTAGRNGP